ncbi:MAG: peroxiredoxin [Methylococcales bacterium]|jgi:peroxiredoxin Q/BCP|nr:peroxiredoxin [Methylococcales bacterium]
MTTVTLGQKVPDFESNATNNTIIKLSDLRGKKVILYFYPKDNTPGCTTEGQDFRNHIAEFTALNTTIFGISRDTLRTHKNFKTKHQFPFELLSDSDESLCTLFDVIKMKNMYGKQVRGIERSTFLIDENGILIEAWRKIRVKEHVATVLTHLKALK